MREEEGGALKRGRNRGRVTDMQFGVNGSNELLDLSR